MRLNEFLDKTAMPQAELARRAGVANNTIWAILQGRDCRISVAIKIYEATDGQVTPNDIAESLMTLTLPKRPLRVGTRKTHK